MLEVATSIQNADEPVEPEELQQLTSLSQTKLTKALSLLEEVDAVEILPTGEVIANSEAEINYESAAAAAVVAGERQQQFEHSRREMMRGYAEEQSCRCQYVLSYFGENLADDCGFCDNCKAGLVTQEDSNHPFPINSTVIHTNFGKGRVLRYESDKIFILFDTVGYKTFLIWCRSYLS